jgi:hypothetical protein
VLAEGTAADNLGSADVATSRAASLDTPPSKAARRSPAAGLSSIAVERLFGILQSCGGKAVNGGHGPHPSRTSLRDLGVSCVSSLSNFAGPKAIH